MVFNTGAALLDAIVLAVVSREKDPVLRRLQKDECLEVYDRQFDGRNRRYYKVTEKGMAQLNLYRVEWKNYSSKINEIFEGGVTA